MSLLAPKSPGLATRLLQHVAWPTLLLGGLVAGWAWQVAWPALHPVWSIFFGGAITLPAIALVQALLPWRHPGAGWRGELWLDVQHMALSNALPNALFSFTCLGGVYAAATWLRAAAGGPIWPLDQPLLLQLAAAAGIADLGFYALHRLLHAVPWLWRLHAIHHSSERLHALSAARNHPLNSLAVYLAQIVPLLLLGAPDHVLALLTLFISVNGWLQHADVDLRTGWLDGAFATPSVHRYHHSTDPAEASTNYGGNLSIWDRAFGTWTPPGPARGPARAGTTGGRVGDGWWAQVIGPFRPEET